MATVPVPGFEGRQLQAALEQCTEAAALGERIHIQLEHVLLGYTVEALPQLQNIHQRLSVVLARVSCARDQLANVLEVHAATTRSEVQP